MPLFTPQNLFLGWALESGDLIGPWPSEINPMEGVLAVWYVIPYRITCIITLTRAECQLSVSLSASPRRFLLPLSSTIDFPLHGVVFTFPSCVATHELLELRHSRRNEKVRCGPRNASFFGF